MASGDTLVTLLEVAGVASTILALLFRKPRTPRVDFRRRALEDNQAELFGRELPPKPSYVADGVARIACSECSELAPMNELEDVENGRVCRACFGKSVETASPYRD